MPDRDCVVASAKNVDRIDLALPFTSAAMEREAQVILERAIALLVAARAIYNLADAPGPVPFEATHRPCPPAPKSPPPPEVVRLTKVFAPPPIEARSLLSIFA